MISAPFYGRVDRACLQISVGTACQNRCLFCIDGDPRGVRAPDDDAVRGILEQNADLPEVLFSRFEPTLSRDLPRWARWARESGFAKVSVISNGRRLGRPGFAERLTEAGVRSFVVSIHGPRADIHDRLTDRPGSFAETVAGLEALCRLREQMPIQIRVVTTACALNVDHLPALHSLVRGFSPQGHGWNAMLLEGRALEHADVLAVPYPRLVDALCHCLEAFPEAPPGLANVPLCFALPRVPLRILPGAEDTRMAEVDPSGRLVGAAAVTQIRPYAFHPRCEDCVLRPTCLGLSPHYVERFGWDGMTPVSPEMLAEAERQGAHLGQPRPFVSSSLLRRLVSPPGRQWEIVELRTGPTDAFVHLRAHRPDRLQVRLVLTPRSAGQPAYRRTRRFNIALQGKHHSRREEAMAAAIVTWIRHQEQGI